VEIMVSLAPQDVPGLQVVQDHVDLKDQTVLQVIGERWELKVLLGI